MQKSINFGSFQGYKHCDNKDKNILTFIYILVKIKRSIYTHFFQFHLLGFKIHYFASNLLLCCVKSTFIFVVLRLVLMLIWEIKYFH